MTVKNVMDNIMEALGEKKDLLEKFNAVSMKLGEVMDDAEMNTLLEEQGELQEKIEACGGWEIEREIEVAMDALRCPPKRRGCEHAFRWRTSACSADQTAFGKT